MALWPEGSIKNFEPHLYLKVETDDFGPVDSGVIDLSRLSSGIPLKRHQDDQYWKGSISLCDMASSQVVRGPHAWDHSTTSGKTEVTADFWITAGPICKAGMEAVNLEQDHKWNSCIPELFEGDDTQATFFPSERDVELLVKDFSKNAPDGHVYVQPHSHEGSGSATSDSQMKFGMRTLAAGVRGSLMVGNVTHVNKTLPTHVHLEVTNKSLPDDVQDTNSSHEV